MNLIPFAAVLSSDDRAHERTLLQSLLRQLKNLQSDKGAWLHAGSAFYARHDDLLTTHQQAMINLDIAFMLAVEQRLSERSLGPVNREQITRGISMLASEYLAIPGIAEKHPVLIEIFDRHSPMSYDNLRRQSLFAMARSLGIDPTTMDGLSNAEIGAAIKAATVKAYESIFGAGNDESSEERTGHSSGERKPPSAVRVAGSKPTGHSRLREVYRRLVRQLHPDRESDAERRRHKTGLMQKANVAYHGNDLPTLLDLQVEAGLLSVEERGEANERLQVDLIESVRHQLTALKATIRSMKDDVRSQACPLCEFPRRLTPKGLTKVLDRMELELVAELNSAKSCNSAVTSASSFTLTYLVLDRAGALA